MCLAVVLVPYGCKQRGEGEEREYLLVLVLP